MPELPQYLYMELADRIAAEIKAGQPPVGGRLPGEREMTEIYGVSIGTVRRAVAELRTRGLVATLPIKGTYVIASEPADSKQGQPAESDQGEA
jgi:DNA-binding GntR family transcriptional regulator